MRGTVVVLCLSVTVLAATYLVYKSQVRHYKVPYGVSNVCIVWISLKTLCSPNLASFASNRVRLPRSLTSSWWRGWTTETVMASLQDNWYVGLAIAPITQRTDSLMHDHSKLSTTLLAFLLDLDLLIWHGTRGTVAYYVIACNVH